VPGADDDRYQSRLSEAISLGALLCWWANLAGPTYEPTTSTKLITSTNWTDHQQTAPDWDHRHSGADRGPSCRHRDRRNDDPAAVAVVPAVTTPPGPSADPARHLGHPGPHLVSSGELSTILPAERGAIEGFARSHYRQLPHRSPAHTTTPPSIWRASRATWRARARASPSTRRASPATSPPKPALPDGGGRR
jgi:hypothetical protein